MENLLIVGAGDVARRALPLLLPRYRVYALTRDHFHAEQLASAGVGPIVGDLDQPDTLAPLAMLAKLPLRVAHLAPPPDHGSADTRTQNLLAAIGQSMVAQGAMATGVRHVVYVSTSGVYGDCAGARVTESRAVNPATDRARRRVAAESAINAWGDAHGARVTILRVPGIYAPDRLPLERLKRGTPVLRAVDDVYTNHIHADDLAAILAQAINDDAAGGIFNASDDSEIKMGDYFDMVADRYGLARPPRVSRAEANAQIPAMLLSFMSESRRLVNRRMKDELNVTLRYPTVYEGVVK